MAQMDISKTTESSISTSVVNVEPSSKTIDGESGLDETTWTNSNWTKYWGIFNSCPEFKSAVLMKGIWNVGKGYEADERTKVILSLITGWGKDTFDDIIFNMDVIRKIGGDSYAERIKDPETGILLNLKPLDPSTMTHVVGKDGILKRFEQRTADGKIIKFKPEDIFYLSNNRLGNQIHGISVIESLQKTIFAEYENFDDMMKQMHLQSRPLIIFKLKTDDQTTIDSIKLKMDNSLATGKQAIYVPDDENVVSWEVVQVNTSQVIFQWRQDITNKFYRALGMPLIIFGQAGSTESGGKIEYTGHEQVWEYEQRYLENQIKEQLGLEIDLISPVSLLENLQTDEQKDANQGLNFKPSDMAAGT
jgi:hypothetical protein